MNQRKTVLLDLLLLSTTLAFFLWLALNRFIAPDEGFYLLASSLVMQGQLIYDDFFYPQMPLFPYLYGLWLAVFDFTWQQARIFAALLTVGVAFLLYLPLKKSTTPLLAASALILFASSGLVIGWFPTAKTYNASTLFCLLSYLLISKSFVKQTPALIFCSGLLLGLTVNVRLFYAILVPLFILWIFIQEKDHRIKHTLYFLLGGLLTVIPHLYLIFTDWSSYWFNNLGYHGIRSEMSPEQIAEHRKFIVEVAFGFRQEARSDGYQLPILFFGAVAHALYRLKNKSLPDMAFWIGMILFVVSFTPVPIHLQYFCASVPFFIICTILFLAEFSAARARVTLWLTRVVAIVVLCIYLISTPQAIERHLISGYGVHGVEDGLEETSRISTAREVAHEINALTEPGEVVLSQWPGFLVESHALPYPGTENQFWVRVGHRLDAEERRNFKIVNRAEFKEIVSNPDLKTVIIEKHKERRYFRGKVLEQNMFERAKEINGVYIYKRLKDK